MPALSQQISVESFTPLENDLTANTAGTMKKDQNGKTCALIKVVTSEKGFNFDVGILGVVATEQKVGEIWVYVPEKIRFITIAHPLLGVLRNYPIPQQDESARTYELRLVTGKVHTVIEEAQTGLACSTFHQPTPFTNLTGNRCCSMPKALHHASSHSENTSIASSAKTTTPRWVR